MKTPRTGKQARPHQTRQAVLSLAVAALATSARAEPYNVWTGNGGDNNWSTSANWSLGTPTGSNYGTLQFSGTNRTANVNDLFLAEHKLLFDSSQAFTLTGNAITFSDYGGVSDPQSKIESYSPSGPTGLVTIGLGINFAATNNADRAEINAVTGDIAFTSAGTVALDGNVAGLRLYGTGHTVTFNGVISGTGRYVELSAGNTASFNAANAYTGDTYVTNGSTARFTASQATTNFVRLGADHASVATGSGAAVELGNAVGGITIASNFNTRPGGAGTLAIRGTNTSGTNIVSGSVYLDAPLTVSIVNAGATLAFTGGAFDLKGQPLTVGGNGTGAGTVRIDSTVSSSSTSATGITVAMAPTGRLVLGGSNTSFGSGTVVTSGTLGITNSSSLGTGIVRLNGGTLSNDAVSAVTLFKDIEVGAANTLSTPGGVAFAGSALNVGGALELVTNGAAITHAITVNNHLTFSGSIAAADSASNGLAIVGSGAGKLILNGNAGYKRPVGITGTTVLANAAGAPNVSATGTGNVTVNATGTLGGTGRVGGTISVSGTITGGDAGTVGVLNTKDQAWNGGGTERVDVSASGRDRIDMLTLDLSGLTAANPFVLNLVSLDGGTLSGKYVLARAAGTTPQAAIRTPSAFGGAQTADGTNLTSLFTLRVNGVVDPFADFTVTTSVADAGSYNGGMALVLDYTPAPEPTTMALLALSGAAVLGRRGRRRLRIAGEMRRNDAC